MADPIIGKISVGDGATFTPAVDNDGVISWSNNKNLPNPASVDIPQAVVDRYHLAPIASPAFTGNPTAPTQGKTDDSTKLATTAYVKSVVADYLALTGGSIVGDVDVAGDVDITGSVTGPSSITFTERGEIGFRGTTHASFDICKQLVLSSTDIDHWGDEGGAKIALHTYDSTGTNTNEDGAFSILATNGTDGCELKGKPNGSLTWRSAEIVPVGVVQAFAGQNTPTGWLLCDGSAVSRTTYAKLFSVIGTSYGSGNGSTTFNLPNLVDKFVEGSATAGTVKSAGLPNITGYIGSLRIRHTNAADSHGALYGSEYENVAASDGTNPSFKKINLDASRSSSVYGNSTTVQPPALTMRYIIKY